MNHEIIIITTIFIVLIVFAFFSILKKEKFAMSIYKLIDDLDKKYIVFFIKKRSIEFYANFFF